MADKVISKEQVEHVAILSNIPVSKDELEKLSNLFTDTLSYMNVIDELDTSNIERTFQVTGLTNIFQKEEATSTTLEQSEVLKNAKDTQSGYFAAPAVFDR